ncbi:hypothetical protein [Nitrospirillum sp. BR 11163]|uniref:hypothetical protein n=1 Tax=Nitrospirillum sp. BR 11163 TaxID=3104323 RepID=UPI002AFF6236|nr:hypothetical protein [Nitrospirillum sp. BR 11163]MEA1674066.1 hypothetical protein [Nitrospirillum sp. BR 11163]
MIRVTIDLLPGGNEAGKRTIGMMEIANVGGDLIQGNYAVILTKTPPFAGALRAAWRRGAMQPGHEDEQVMAGEVVGHHRTQRGVYDLLYRALMAVGMHQRLPRHARQEGSVAP